MPSDEKQVSGVGQIKLHAHIFKTVAGLLSECILELRASDKVLEYAFRTNKKWGSRDRKIIAETLFESVRWWRKLLWSYGLEQAQPQDFLNLVLIMFLSRNPEARLPEFMDETTDHYANLKAAADKLLRTAAFPPIELSVPEWLMQEMSQQMGVATATRILARSNRVAPVFLRVNRLKSTVSEVIRRLDLAEIKTRLVEGDCLVLDERKNVFSTEAFKQGLFEVQDQHSQQVALFLKPQAGERIIDACAGAGGKSLHLAALMKGRGQVIALDVYDRKLAELRVRATRSGASNITTKHIDSSKVIKRLHGSADRLLLDVPCSGLGVLRRNPDTKWRLKQEEVRRLELLQAEILQNYCSLVKQGGVLVYSTCSVLPSENEKQIEKFLAAHKNWELEEQRHIGPEPQGGDGFYMARLRML